MNSLIEWLLKFTYRKETDVHGDYSLTNVMIGKSDPNVIAILDWELSTLEILVPTLTITVSIHWTQNLQIKNTANSKAFPLLMTTLKCILRLI